MSRLTLLIASRNQPAHLERMVSFYKDKQFPYNIIIVDSSDDALYEEKKQILRSLSLLNVELQSFAPRCTYPEKILQAARRIKTPFIVAGDLSTFFVPEMLEECMDFLEANSEYSSVYGDHYGFTSSSGSNPRFFSLNSYYSIGSLEHADPLERLHAISHSPRTLIYALHRHSAFTSIMYETYMNAEKDLFLWEILFYSLWAVRGNIKYLQAPYMIHECSSGQISINFSSKEFNQVKESAITTLAKYLVLKVGVEDTRALKEAKKSLEVFIAYFQNKYSSQKSWIQKIISSVVRMDVFPFRRIFRRWKRKRLERRTLLPAFACAKNKTLPYYENLVLIKKKVKASKIKAHWRLEKEYVRLRI